ISNGSAFWPVPMHAGLGCAGSTNHTAPPSGVTLQCQPGALLHPIMRHESGGVDPDWIGIRWIEQTGIGPRLMTPNVTFTMGGSRLKVSHSVWMILTGDWA